MNLKIIRKNTGLTQEEVAKKLNIARTTYKNYENEDREPNFETLIKIAKLFNTTTDEILGHEIPYQINKSIFTEEQLEIIEEIKTLDKEQCYKILAYIDGLKDGKENRTKTIEKLRSK